MSTRDSCEREDPATATPGGEEVAESLMPPRHPPPTPTPLLPNGRRGERRPHERQCEGHPPSLPNGRGGGGGGDPASEEAKSEGGRVGGAAERLEPEGRDLWRLL